MKLPMFEDEPTPDFLETIACKSGCEPMPPDVRVQEIHIGAYCGNCGRWMKWLQQTEELKQWLRENRNWKR